MDWEQAARIESIKLGIDRAPRDEKPRFPLFSGDYNKLKDVPQMAWEIATIESERPILATSGLANCIGVVAYDPLRKLAFLSHSDALTCACGHYNKRGAYIEENGHVRSFYRKLQEIGREFSLDVKMVLGSDPDKKMIDITKRSIETVPPRVSLTTLEEIYMGTIGSIAIDVRTGQFFTYDPMRNPNPKTLGILDRLPLNSS